MRKKLMVLLSILLILTLTIAPGTQTAQASNDNSIVRVKISIGTPSQYSFTVDGNYSVNGIALDRQIYTVKANGSGLALYCGSTLITSGSSIKLVQHTATSGTNNYISMYNSHYSSTCHYLGDMEFLNVSGIIQAINHVYIEYYLYGVVPYEMSDSWPADALKAQAIAARNYAIKKMSSSGNYDLLDTSSSQVYKGYNSTKTNAISAVDATAGQVITYNGSVISAYYSASNGGWTDIPYHIWGGGATWQYYVIEQDTYDRDNPDSLYETIFIPATNIEPSLNSFTATTSDNYSSTQPNASPALSYIKQEIVNSAQLKNYGVTNVNDFLLTGVTDLYTYEYDVSGSQDHSRTPWDGVNDCVDKIKAQGDFIVSVGGNSYTVNDLNIDLRYLDGSNGCTTYQSFYAPLNIFLIEPVMSGSTLAGYNISHKRYGHGCGLSQRGAQQRANSGQSYQDILSFYYPNTSLTKLSCSAPILSPIGVNIEYQSHVQNIGWQNWVSNCGISGTSGQSLRMEAVRIQLDGIDGGVEYKTHVQNIGWMDWVSNGALSGTEGRSLRLEAIQIRLTGNAANEYDIYYRVHAQNIGWMDWAKNGQSAGTAGYSYRLEAMQIVLVPKGGAAPGSTATPFKDASSELSVKYQTHVQNVGWQGWKSNGETAGTSGQSLRLEGMYIEVNGADNCIEYRTHVQNIGWQDWVNEGEMTGTSGQSLRLEAIEVRLKGDMAANYDIYYRVHAQNIGWMDWAKNGQSAGTAGLSYRLEAIQIVLVPKGGAAPGSTSTPFVSS